MGREGGGGEIEGDKGDGMDFGEGRADGEEGELMVMEWGEREEGER